MKHALQSIRLLVVLTMMFGLAFVQVGGVAAEHEEGHEVVLVCNLVSGIVIAFPRAAIDEGEVVIGRYPFILADEGAAVGEECSGEINGEEPGPTDPPTDDDGTPVEQPSHKPIDDDDGVDVVDTSDTVDTGEDAVVAVDGGTVTTLPTTGQGNASGNGGTVVLLLSALSVIALAGAFAWRQRRAA